MKTDEWIQLGALGLIAYLAYQKFGQAKSPSTSIPTVPVQPSVQIPSPDFGVTNPSDTTWGDSSLPADFGLQNVIDWATAT